MFARVAFGLERHEVVAVAASSDPKKTGTVIRCDGYNLHGAVAEMADGSGAHAAISRMKIARAIAFHSPHFFTNLNRRLTTSTQFVVTRAGARFKRRAGQSRVTGN
jgi:hypothetical protein